MSRIVLALGYTVLSFVSGFILYRAKELSFEDSEIVLFKTIFVCQVLCAIMYSIAVIW